MRAVTTHELRSHIQGEWVGDEDILIGGVSEISSARAGDLVYAVSKEKAQLVESCQASFAILPQGTWRLKIPHVKVTNPYLAFAKVLRVMDSYVPTDDRIHPNTSIHETAQIGTDVVLYPGVFVDAGVSIGDRTVVYANVSLGQGVTIGEDCLIHSNCSIRESVKIGDRVILQPNAVIGSDGYGYAPHKGVHHKIPQLGTVILGDDVEVGAGTTIDRGTFRETWIGNGTKLDNLVQVGHNVKMGIGCLMASQSGLSGSTILGDYVTFGGQSGSVGHITIGSNATIVARGAPAKDVPEGSMISGFPGRDHRLQMKILAAQGRIVGLRRELREAIKSLSLKN